MGFYLYVWSVVEWNLGIICACAPSLRVFFRSYLMTSFNRSKGSKGSQNSNHGGDRKSAGMCWGNKQAALDDYPPSHAIELKRSVTVESDTDFHSQDKKPLFRESIRSKSTSNRDTGSGRVGLVYQTRTYHHPVTEEPFQEDIEAARSYDPIASNNVYDKSTASISTECQGCRAKSQQRSASAQRTFFRSESSDTLARELRQNSVHSTPPLPSSPPRTALPPMPSAGYQELPDSPMRSASLPAQGDGDAPKTTAEEEDDPMRPDSVMFAMMGRGRF